jgi:hypothetical protein
MVKTVCRTIIMRDYDINKVVYTSIRKKLYDRITFEPLTYQELKNENLVKRLRDEPVPQYSVLPNIGVELLHRERDLYNRAYLSWDLTMDYPDGQIYVQSRSDQPKEALMRVTFEKDYDTSD